MSVPVYSLTGPDATGPDHLAGLGRAVGEAARSLGLWLVFRHTRHEGVLIDWIHEAGAAGAAGIVLNPGALARTSLAVPEALAAVALPVAEIDTNPASARAQPWLGRFPGIATVGCFAGPDCRGYRLALQALADHLSQKREA